MTIHERIDGSDPASEWAGQTPISEVMAAALDGLYVGRDNKAIIVAKSGTIISINPLAARLCGSVPAAFIGKMVSDLFGEPALGDASGESAKRRWETDLRTASGDIVPIEVVREPLGRRLPGTLVFAVRDLRERIEAAAERERKNQALHERDKQLRIQNQRFDTAIHNMRQGLAMFDAEERLLVCNTRFWELYGIPTEELQPGKSIKEVIRHSSTLGDVDLQACLQGGLSMIRDGSTFVQRLTNGKLLLVSCRKMQDNGLVITTDDITEREQEKSKLQEYTVKLEASNQELQNFAHIASHDLQEPLRKIETFIDRSLKKDKSALPPDTAASMERIQHAAKRMRSLINDLLDYARLTSEPKAFASVSLADTLKGVLSDLQVRIEETKAQIYPGELPNIAADATQMRQLMQNVLSNALKFSRPGVQPVIKIGAVVEPATGCGTATLVLTFADNGIGFDNRFKDQIFKIFQRLHGRTEYEGTGIGLATCRKIVERHQGTIDAEGRPGIGATIIVRLPINRASP